MPRASTYNDRLLLVVGVPAQERTGFALARTPCYTLPRRPGRPFDEGGEDSAEEVTGSLAEVKVQDSESIESALRRFKRKVQQEDIIKDIKKHSFYLKPGDKRRAKQALARKRTRKKQRRETE